MMKTVSLSGEKFAVEDVGEGRPLLLVHGFPLDRSMWVRQIEDLQSVCRVIAPDLRGFGESVVSSGTVTMEQYADDLAHLLDELHVTEPVIYCGLSMGGYIGWQFFQRHRAKLAALIQCDTRAAADTPAARQGRHELADRVLRDGPEFVADSMLPKLFAVTSQTRWSDVVRHTREVILKTNPDGIAAAARGMAVRPAVTGWLSTIDVPTLMIAGTHDAISPPEEMREWAKLIPKSRFVEISGAGHMSVLENPEAANAAIREFVAR